MQNARWIPLLLAAFAACAPNTPIRRTALIPAPYLPSRTGAPLDDLQVRIQGEVNPVRLSDGEDPVSSAIHETVKWGDPGLLIPQVELGGSVYFAPIRYVEFGGQIHYASWRWSRANKRGVLDFPEGARRDVWQGGLGVRGNIPIGRRDSTLSPILELNLVRVPEATFLREGTLGSPDAGYRYQGLYQSTFFYPAFFLQFDQGFLNRMLHLHVLVGFERTLTNIGFDSIDRAGSTVRSAMTIPIGVGLEFDYRWFTVGTTFFYPVAFGDNLEAGTFGPSLAIRIGVVLGGRNRSDLPPADRGPEPRPRRDRGEPARPATPGMDEAPPPEQAPPPSDEAAPP